MRASTGKRIQKHRSAQEWRALVRAWKESGKTKRAWCDENGLSLESLRRWMKRFRNQPDSEMSIVEIPRVWGPAGAVPAIRVFVGAELRIELSAEVSEELLRQVLRAAVEMARVH
jgi:hypothetical protein